MYLPNNYFTEMVFIAASLDPESVFDDVQDYVECTVITLMCNI